MKRKILGVMLVSAIFAGAVAEMPLKSLAEKISDTIYPAYEMTVNNSADAVIGETVVGEVTGEATGGTTVEGGGAAVEGGSTTVEGGGTTTEEDTTTDEIVDDSIVNVTTIEEFQSEHDYNSYEDKTWVYTHPEPADSITITFSEDTETEDSYDCIYIYDGSDALLGTYSGNELAGKSITVEGSVIKVHLTSDGSVEYYGFRVTAIDAVVSTGPITNLKRTKRDKSSVTLTFPTPKNATSVTVEQSADGVSWTPAVTEALSAESTTATVTGLEMETEYHFRLNVVGGDREGISNVITVTTLGNFTSEEYFTFEDGVISAYTGTDTEVIIPPEVNGVAVTQLGYGIFSGCDTVTSIKIPEGVTEIGYNAFHGCSALTKVDIPDTVTRIGGMAFYKCTAITEIDIPESVTYIDDNAFGYCENLEKIKLPSGITSIYTKLFTHCKKLTSIEIPYGVTYIANGAFEDCENVESIIIPDTVTTISGSAFSGCESLKSIDLPLNITAIENSMFNGCTSLTEITIPENVTRIGQNAFGSCSGLTKITVPSNVKTIEGRAFSNCTSLEDITIPDGVSTMGEAILYNTKYYNNESNWENGILYHGTYLLDTKSDFTGELVVKEGITSIAENTFSQFRNITSVVLPSTLTSIGSRAFYYCTGLTEITIPENMLKVGSEAFAYCENLGTINWNAIKSDNIGSYSRVFRGSGNRAENGITAVFGEDVEYIPSYIFEGCTALKEVTIPEGVKEVDDHPFSGCTGLEKVYWNAVNANHDYYKQSVFDTNLTKPIEVVFGENVETLPAYMFSGCKWLTEITIPGKLTEIPVSMFDNCTALSAVNIPEGITKIGNYAFSGCSLIESVTIPDSVTEIGNYAFSKSGLKTFEISDNLTIIGDYAFSKIPITELTIPETVTSIGNAAFEECEALEKVYWNAVRAEAENCFRYSGVPSDENENGDIIINGMEAVFGDSVEYIPESIFRSSFLNDVKIGENVTEIGSYAFYGTDITAAVIPDSVRIIGDYAFNGCMYLSEVKLSKNLQKLATSTRGSTFANCWQLTEIEIPESVTYVGEMTFYGCDKLEKVYWNAASITDQYDDWSKVFNGAGYDAENGLTVIFGDGVREVPEYLFHNNKFLTNVEMSDTVKTIGDYAFDGCISLTDAGIGAGVTDIGYKAYNGCPFTELTVPQNVANVYSSFMNCTNLEKVYWNASDTEIETRWSDESLFLNSGSENGLSVIFGDTAQIVPTALMNSNTALNSVVFSDGVQEIGGSAFYGCANLDDITFGKGLLVIGYSAFEGTSIKSLVIPDSVLEVAGYAFAKCESLTDITIGINVRTIDSYAFSYCPNMKNIYWNAENVTTSYYGKSPFKGSGTNSEMSVVFGETVKSIPDDAFYEVEKVTSVVIGDSVTTIGDSAFYCCWDIKELTVGKGVLSVGNNAFRDITKLEKVYWNASNATFSDYNHYNFIDSGTESGFTAVFGDEVTTIPDWLFFWTDNLASVEMGEKVTKIGEAAFSGSPLTDFTIPNSVTYIGSSAFLNSQFSSVNLSNLKYLGEHAFWDSGLTSVNIDGLEYMGDGPFKACEKLKSASINGSVLELSEEAFKSCTALEEVRLGNGVVGVGNYAFDYCTALNTVNCPSVRYVGYSAFSGSGIPSISLPKCESVAGSAFSSCRNLSNVSFSMNVGYVGYGAFSYCPLLKSVTVPSNSVCEKYDDMPDVKVFEGSYDLDCSNFSIWGKTLVKPGERFVISKSMDVPTGWESSDENVAIVGDGIVTAKAKGKTVITGSTWKGNSDTITLVVTNTTLNMLSDSYSVVPDDTVVVYAKLESEDYTGADAVWTTNNTSISRVESTGWLDNGDNTYTLYAVVTGEDPGSATVNVKVKEVSDYALITVEDESKKFCKYIVEDSETREPIEGASITVGGISQTTGADGSATYEKEVFGNSFFVPISVTANGYADKNYKTSVYTGGTSYVSMRKKDGKITIEDVQLTLESGKVRDLKNAKTNIVFVEDLSYSSTLDVFVDWGDYDEGKIFFVTGNKRVEMSGSMSKDFGMEYENGDTFSVYAETYDDDGEVISTTRSLPIKIMKAPNNFLPKTDGKISMSQIPFFEENTIAPGFGKVQQKVSAANNVLEVSIGGSQGYFTIFNGEDLDAEISGKLQIPLDDLGGGEWKGTIYASIDYIKLLDNDVNGTVPIGPVMVPVVLSYEIGGSVNGQMGVVGPLDKLKFTGDLGANFELEVFGGVGFEVEGTGAKIGLYGEGEGDLRYEFNKDGGKFNPSVGIEIGAKASAKIFDIGPELTYEILNIWYDREGWNGTAFGGSKELFALSPREQSLDTVGRDYLDEDSGFVANYAAAPMSAELVNRYKTKVYQNSISVAEAEMSYINDRKHVFFTVDDIDRDEQNSLKLVYSVQNLFGEWSEPVAIEDDGTLDTDISVSGDYVIWEDSNTVFDNTSDELANYMLKTDITAARINDDGSIDTYTLSDDGLYDCAPVIKETPSGAAAAWISNSSGDIMRLSGQNNICYSIMEDETWSEVKVIENVGAIGNPRVAVEDGKVYIFYSKSGELHAYSDADKTDRVLMSGLRKYDVAEVNGKIALAYFNADNELYFDGDILSGVDAQKIKTDTKNLNATEPPEIISNDDATYIIWLGRNGGYNSFAGVRYEDGMWSEDIQFVTEEKDIKEPSLIMSEDSVFAVCYFSETNTVNDDASITVSDCDLYVCDILPSHNIKVGNVTYDDACYKENGVINASVSVENIGELPINGYTVSILDGDAVMKTVDVTETFVAGSENTEVLEFEFANKSNAKTFNIKVTPLEETDFDDSDNSSTLTVGKYDVKIEDAYVAEERDRTYLNILVVNEGSLKTGSAEVKVYNSSEEGDLLYTYTTERLEACEGELSKIDITDISADISTLCAVVYVKDDSDPTDNMSLVGLADYTPPENKNEGVTVKEGAVSQSGAAIEGASPKDIESIIFEVETDGADAVFYVGCYNSDGRLLKLYEKSETLTADSTSVSIATPDIPMDTSIVSLLAWKSGTMIPLGEKTVFSLNEEISVNVADVVKDNNTVSAVITSNKDVTADVYTAVYDSNNKLLAIEVQEVTLTKDVGFNYSQQVTADGNAAIYVWEKDSMIPLCEKY